MLPSSSSTRPSSTLDATAATTARPLQLAQQHIRCSRRRSSRRFSCCRRRGATPCSRSCCASRTSSSRSTSSTPSPMRPPRSRRVRAALAAFVAEAGFAPAGTRADLGAAWRQRHAGRALIAGYDGPIVLLAWSSSCRAKVRTDGTGLGCPCSTSAATAEAAPGHARACSGGRVARGAVAVGDELGSSFQAASRRASQSCTPLVGRVARRSAPIAWSASASSIASSTSRAETWAGDAGSGRASRRAFAPRSPGSTANPAGDRRPQVLAASRQPLAAGPHHCDREPARHNDARRARRRRARRQRQRRGRGRDSAAIAAGTLRHRRRRRCPARRRSRRRTDQRRIPRSANRSRRPRRRARCGAANTSLRAVGSGRTRRRQRSASAARSPSRRRPRRP